MFTLRHGTSQSINRMAPILAPLAKDLANRKIGQLNAAATSYERQRDYRHAQELHRVAERGEGVFQQADHVKS
jgi:hypothetical protein